MATREEQRRARREARRHEAEAAAMLTLQPASPAAVTLSPQQHTTSSSGGSRSITRSDVSPRVATRHSEASPPPQPQSVGQSQTLRPTFSVSAEMQTPVAESPVATSMSLAAQGPTTSSSPLDAWRESITRTESAIADFSPVQPVEAADDYTEALASTPTASVVWGAAPTASVVGEATKMVPNNDAVSSPRKQQQLEETGAAGTTNHQPNTKTLDGLLARLKQDSLRGGAIIHEMPPAPRWSATKETESLSSFRTKQYAGSAAAATRTVGGLDATVVATAAGALRSGETSPWRAYSPIRGGTTASARSTSPEEVAREGRGSALSASTPSSLWSSQYRSSTSGGLSLASQASSKSTSTTQMMEAVFRRHAAGGVATAREDGYGQRRSLRTRQRGAGKSVAAMPYERSYPEVSISGGGSDIDELLANLTKRQNTDRGPTDALREPMVGNSLDNSLDNSLGNSLGNSSNVGSSSTYTPLSVSLHQGASSTGHELDMLLAQLKAGNKR